MPTPEEVRARVASAYDRAADFYDHAANAFWDRFGRRTIERLGLARGARVLDLCCGAGASAIPAAQAVGPEGRVVGVDLSVELTRLGEAKAARLGLKNVEFRVADLLDLPLEGESFDVVVCVFGVFFVPDMAVAVRAMGAFVRPGGRLALTTWGRGLFEPVNSTFWEAVRRIRPELYKSFQPWDRLGDAQLVRGLFEEAGLAAPEVVFEPGTHPIRGEEDVAALIRGTGYRGTLEQIAPAEAARLCEEVAKSTRAAGTSSVRADVLYATWTEQGAARRG